MPKNNPTMSVGPFVEWKRRSLPKCVCKDNADYSTVGMSRAQRDYVLRLYGYANYRDYLQSELWASIRAKILREAKCFCGCGRQSTQVHHRSYTEANLLGFDLRGLVGLNGGCHHGIEFSDKRKNSLGQANRTLRKQQFDNAAGFAPPSDDDIKSFLSGNHRTMPIETKLAVKRYLKLTHARA